MSVIRLLPLQFSAIDELEECCNLIESRFKINAFVHETPFDLTQFFNPERSQYNANDIIQALPRLGEDIHDKVIAVTDVDLYIPVLTYIFGQAYLGGRAALVSGYRLRNERYGLEPDQGLFNQRLIKGVLHELGHAHGLKHCFHPTCIMLSSTYVEEVDLKSDRFCNNCQSELNRLTSPYH